MKLSELSITSSTKRARNMHLECPANFIMPTWQEFTKDPAVVLARHESGGRSWLMGTPAQQGC